MDRDPWLKALIVLLVLIAASYLTGLVWTLAVRFADILLLLVLAWLVSFALEPVTFFLEARPRINRGLAVGIVYLGLLIILSLLTLMLVPVVALQVTQIGTSLPSYVDSISGWVVSFQYWLGERGIDLNAATLLDYREAARRIESLSPVIVNNALGLATGVANVLFSLILVLMFSFYIMLDGHRFTSALSQAVPADRRDEINYLFYSTHRAFGGYIRGQLIQALVYGSGTAAIMLIGGLNYVAVTAIFATAIMMIPFVGPILAIIPPVAISLFVHPDQAWWLFLLLLLLQQLVLNVLAPRVMGRSVGVHPLMVLVALLVGAKLAGAWGAIFAVPVAAVIVAMVSFYRMTVEERKRHLERKSEDPAWQAVAESQGNGNSSQDATVADTR
ncbi:MAG: AI-2E family transporter [Chloroflexota bacterium]